MRLPSLLFAVLFVAYGTQDSFAAGLVSGKFDERSYSSNKSVKDYEDASLASTRLILQKQFLEIESEEINFQQHARVASVPAAETPEDSASSLAAEDTPIPQLFQALTLQTNSVASSNPEADLIYGELTRNQGDSPLGLVVSYTQQAGLESQGFTYDQAIAGIAMLKQGDTTGASKILDFFKARWDGTGFFTVYNTQILNGYSVEHDQILGPNAWIALFALQYHAKTGDAAALDLATQIAHWAVALPHTSGGIAMGEEGTAWGERYSVENNLSFYGVLQLLSTNAASASDRQLFSGERDRLKQWLQFPAYAPSEGLFRRGAYLDTLKALDTSTWGILSLGVSGLQDIGVDVNALVSTIEQAYMVNSLEGYGSYGGDVSIAKGFDFSYSTNAFLAGREAVKWVEGTNQMITVYRQLSAYYSNPATQDLTLAAHYSARADYFSSLNANDRLVTSGGVSYTYSDRANTQVFFDVPSWRTAYGPSVASAAWVYYSLYGFNPFEII